MADNYLENKMEEYRRTSPRRTSRLTPSGRKPGFALLPFDITAALVTTERIDHTTEAVISELRGTGCHVALVCAAPEAAKAAQRLSCVFIPPSHDCMRLAAKAIGEPGLRINIAADRIEVTTESGTSVIRASEDTDTDTFAQRSAQTVVWLALPLSRMYIKRDITL
ncbi:MAG: hypothetical protein J6J93_10725 [Muribaculaceae bacterium]|nr:hypothetical protein [Muribaculaceae bacterium]